MKIASLDDPDYTFTPKTNKKLQEALDAINKKFGDGTTMLYGDSPETDVDVVSTSIPTLDNILGIGGFPRGRIVEVFGPESSGKTTLTLQTLAEAQKAGLQVAFVDVEHALDPKYATLLGVDMDNVLISQPDSAEQALEVVEALARSGQVAVIVLDSVAALTSRAELNGEFGDALVGVIARLMGSAMRKLTATVADNNVLLIFINQLRDKIGGFGYGPTQTTTGGHALKYQASVRLETRRISSIKAGEKVIGHKTKIKVVKNKFSAPHQETESDLIYGEGFSSEGDILDTAIASGVIAKSGAWFTFDGANIGQGRDKARKALKDVELLGKIKDRLNSIDKQ